MKLYDPLHNVWNANTDISTMNLLHQLRVLSSVGTSTLAAWRGTMLLHAATQPPLPLRLYDMESSPYCRKVREALTALGLDAEIYPCPQNGKRFRPQVKKIGGKAQFPYFEDSNTGTALYESSAIVDYLFQTYGHMPTPSGFHSHAVQRSLSVLGTLARGIPGLRYRAAKVPKQLLHLWSFESSPFSRLVRERLTELELPYVLHNVGKEHWSELGPATQRLQRGPYVPAPGGKRAQMLAHAGRVQVPYLEDPNTGTQLFESEKILAYLEGEYALG